MAAYGLGHHMDLRVSHTRPSQTQRMLPHVAHERQPQAALHTSGLRSSSTRGAATPRALAPSSARPRLAPCRSAVMDAPAPAAAGAPALADIPLASVINTSGMILPETPEGARGAVYAIYDEKQKLQYVGTTTDLRNALRAALGRRPEKTHYYKAAHLPTADTPALQAVRDAWFSECGGQPNGNRLAIERTMWQQPVDAGAISERGRKGAAEEKARQLQATLRDRGCKEDFTPNPTLLLEGQVEFLAARNLSDEEMAAEREAEAERMRGRRSCSCLVDGQERTFHTNYLLKHVTAGGHLMDLSVLFDGRETNHRIIVGREYYEPFGLTPEAACEAAIALLLRAKVARATEGMLMSSQFPVNYFALGQVEQWFGEEFRAEFERLSGGVQLQDGTGNSWRFNRIHDYGAMRNETAEQLSVALGNADSRQVAAEVAAALAENLAEAAAAARSREGLAPKEREEEELPQGRGILDRFF
ncbi:hypothetical protein CHLRE_16g671950v5 [Chlamydomonas reinhardtii]|uniref:GIY-YIG domain-containing protein n=1 Tax=Chlamydomonas reinhardtii TaxID=3055 RepID=A0A2K3CVP8_CHLRE|nr:uncharacterized protein CHLRE_16g671950v5 [Chlamydomonas reinhardtii]PNW72346.1 hypothetical protein CHLRE_16g671950v5 [Chlamydomonas reinhardtii]